jgi:protein gp37
MSKSKIEWTQVVWNPTTGCTEVSAGCANCYAKIMSKRLQAMGQPKYKDNFEVRIHPSELQIPYKWKKPRVVFVNSMSDLFHKDVPLEFIKQVFKVMNENPQHTFQVLTKRAKRLFELQEELEWTPNIWMGVSVENQKVIDRIDFLRKTNAKTKFLSLEPLLGTLPNLNLLDIDWAIVGGESGPKSRPIEKAWVEDIQNQCKEQNVAFFFKQWGGKNKKKAGRLLDGKTYDEMPIYNY